MWPNKGGATVLRTKENFVAIWLRIPWMISCCLVLHLLYGLDVGLSLCFVASSSSFLRATSPVRKLQRQASIYQRAHITKQTSVTGTSPPEGDSVLLPQEVMSSLPETESEQDSGSHRNAFETRL